MNIINCRIMFVHHIQDRDTGFRERINEFYPLLSLSTKVPVSSFGTCINILKLHVERHKGLYEVGSSYNWRTISAKKDLSRAPIHEFIQLSQFILRNEMQHR